MRAKRQAYCEAGRHSNAERSAAAEETASEAAAAAATEGSLRQLMQALLPDQGKAAGAGDVVFVAEHRQVRS
jgi:hypothetical protein